MQISHKLQFKPVAHTSTQQLDIWLTKKILSLFFSLDVCLWTLHLPLVLWSLEQLLTPLILLIYDCCVVQWGPATCANCNCNTTDCDTTVTFPTSTPLWHHWLTSLTLMSLTVTLLTAISRWYHHDHCSSASLMYLTLKPYSHTSHTVESGCKLPW